MPGSYWAVHLAFAICLVDRNNFSSGAVIDIYRYIRASGACKAPPHKNLIIAWRLRII
jgi:hypothetical protein